MSRGRILQTGVTTQHAGRGTRFKYDPVAKLLGDALRHYGYEVDHRIAVPDEDLSQYDAVFAGLGPVNSISARYTYGGLDVMSRANASGAALVYYIDDWQTHLITAAARTMVKANWRLVRPTYSGQNKTGAVCRIDFDWATQNLDRLIGVCDSLINQQWPTTVMPLYAGGDWDLFRSKVPTDNLVGIDPTPFYTDYGVTGVEDRLRREEWVFGVLSDQTRWIDGLERDWPLAHFGGRASKSEVGLREPELVATYAESWGVLSCPYWHAGSGWFRIRHDHSAQAGSILVSESPELTFISDAYGVTAQQVEEMSVSERGDVAREQQRAWFAQRPTQDAVAQQLGTMMDAEIAKLRS